MALSYEFSIGSVRAHEKSLFTHADIEQLLACQSEEQLAATLVDKGYGDGKTVDEKIESRTEEVWTYLKSIAPDFGIFSVFIIQNDVHNFKVVLKGTMADREYLHLLVKPSTIDADVLIKAVENRRYSKLPEWLSKAAEQAYDTLAHTGDARLSDALLDTALMNEMLRLSAEGDSRFLKEYVKTLIFYNNIKIALRAARTGTGRDYLLKALCEVEGFNKSNVISACMKGGGFLVGELEKTSDYGCCEAIKKYKKSPSAFERFVDDTLMKAARESCKRASEGAEPMLGYYLGSETEKKVIHIIASGIRTGSGTEIIRERLREIYG